MPHRAFYTLALEESRPGSGVVDVTGAMSYSVEDACSAWLVEQRIDMRRVIEQGDILTSIGFTSWESKNGLRYRFHVRTYQDGQLADEMKGEASLGGRGRGGKARYALPAGQTVDLPAGAYFPMAHLGTVIDRALDGRRYFTAPLFDGGDGEGAYLVNAVIGKRRAPARLPDLPAAQAVWPVQMAFFSTTGPGDLPSYEVRILLDDNGIASAISLDYGDFVLGGAIERFEALPRPRC